MPHPQPAGVPRRVRSAQEAPISEGQGELNRAVKRCATGKATQLIQQGIDPGFIRPEGGNPLLDVGKRASSFQSQTCQSAALIRRRLCGGDVSGLQI